jgi:uncharacterized membrane protein (UPF0127 family)
VRHGRVVERTTGRAVATRVGRADRWWLRLRGLLGRDALAEGEGLWLVPCPSVHMLGMRLPLDVALLDRDGRVVATFEALPPGRRVASARGAYVALELGAGALRRAGIGPGTLLDWEDTT